jgi:DNA-binding SARP family transcriptional activator/Tol biopolymer transport system component/tRNA A-37 threonylcarbamoyl transferase component Bud32
VASVRRHAVVRFAAMEFLILGPLEVADDGRKLALGGPKQRAVLAYLILRANRVVQADLLIDGLWGEEPPESARNTLQTYVYRLRKLLGENRIEGRDGGYVLVAAPDEIDGVRFELLVKEGKASIASDPAAAAAIFADALSLWRADALADVTEEPSLRGEAARLEELRLAATEHRIAAEIAMGGHSTVVSELESLTARYPLRERMWANLMLALYRSGRQAEALSTYQRARQVLGDELGADPSPELQRLHEQILTRAPDLAAPQPERARPPSVRSSRVDLQPGTEVAGYRIVSTLGRGGMSVVYLAEHDWLQRKVALKVLAPQLAEDERFRERFVRESRLAASLDHPNVIPIYEAGASGGDLFIAMRYVEGTDLRTLLHEGGALEPGRAVAIVRQVAAALDAAHEQGLVHRDVKPGNVLLARQRGSEAGEHVYLSDFGLTKRSASDSGITGTGQFVGTLDYAAPEQFKGGTPDARTDVYSLGCVLFECLTGSPPFTSENDAGLMYAHLQEPPPSATARNAGLPREVDGVVAKAMAKAPPDRYPAAGAFADEASRALGLSVEGIPAADGRTRSRRFVPALAVAVALVVGVVASSILQGDATPADGGGPPASALAASPSPVPPTFRTVERALSDAEEQLLTYVPGDVSSECLPLDRDAPIHGERATLVCRTADVEVLYQLFQTRDEMDDAFQVNANNKAAPDGECATDHLAVGSYTIGGEEAGRVLCYTVKRGSFTEELPPQSHIEWTDENASIYTHAIRNDLGDLSLYEWWLTSAGPSSPDGSVPTKDSPRTASGPRLTDGIFLAVPPRGCAGFEGETCAMYIEGDSYRLMIKPFDTPANPSETGSLLLQKPDAVVFSPTSGYCFGGGQVVAPPRPAAYRWSGSGDAITFVKTEGGDCAGPQKMARAYVSWTRAPDGVVAVEEGGEIELVDTGGSLVQSTTQAETNPNSWPDWSPDASKIVYAGVAGADGSDLYVMNAEGTAIDQITDMLGDERTPAWAPDGDRIVFTFDDFGEPDYRSGLATVDPAGSAWTELLARENEDVDLPVWSPDGTRIGFTIFRNGVPAPYVIDADGGGLVKLRDDPGVVLAWTPDGRRILVGGDGSFLTVRPDGSDERMFLEDPPEDGVLALDWSPDGRWMVMSPPSGLGSTLYLMRADGSQLFRIGFGTEPSWRPETP